MSGEGLTPRGAEALAEIERVLAAAARETPEEAARRWREIQARQVEQSIFRVACLLWPQARAGVAIPPLLSAAPGLRLLAQELREAADNIDALLFLLEDQA